MFDPQIDPLKPLNIISDVLGLHNTCFMRKFGKRHRNPDVFTYDSSIDYKEDYSLIPESSCDCGCKSAIYIKEEWDGDHTYTEIKSQKEWELLPSKPKPTPEQIKLQTEIILADREEEQLGIIHNQQSCEMIPVPKLTFSIPQNTRTIELAEGPTIISEYPKKEEPGWVVRGPQASQEDIDSYDLRNPKFTHSPSCKCFECRRP